MSEADAKERIGFIGAGTMGHGMCLCLLKAGHPVNVNAQYGRVQRS